MFWCTRWGFAVSARGPSARRRDIFQYSLLGQGIVFLALGHRKSLPVGFCSTRPYETLSTFRLTGSSAHEPWVLACPAGTKKHPTRGVLVYPLGLEPRLDGVGGRNVIQLHYEYVSVFSFFLKVTLFYYFLLPFCKHLCYTIFKIR